MVVDAHDHACLLYATPEQQHAVIGRAMSEALARGDRFLYIVDQDAGSHVLGALQRSGIDVEDALDDGALVVKSAAESYLEGGRFEPERMVDLLRDAVQEAIADGFRGLTASGEMTWATRGAPGADKLIDYERRVHALFPQLHVAGICQYDARAFDPETLAGVLRAHPFVVAHETLTRNPYYEPEAPVRPPSST